MKKLIFLTIGTIIIILNQAPARATEFQENTANKLGKALTKTQIEAIANARRQDLPVDVVDLTINGIPRSIVILGETHVKIQTTSNYEKELISKFPIHLIENMSGTGLPPTILETILRKTDMGWFKLFVFIDNLSPKKIADDSLVESSILQTERNGVSIVPSGRVYYDQEQIGLITNGSFFPDQNNLSQIIRNSQPEAPGPFLKKLFKAVPKIAIALQNINNESESLLSSNSRQNVRVGFEDDESDESKSGTQIPIKAKFEPNAFSLNLSIEMGALDIWQNPNACKGLTCARSGQFSTRDLRMTNTIYEVLKTVNEIESAIVLVGNTHRPLITKLLENWPTLKAYYLSPED
jgi:hypothetical protein